MKRAWGAVVLVLGAVAPASAGDRPAPFRVEVVDADDGWPVPLVELRTTGRIRFVTDNAGVAAVDAPELMGRETWFFVSGDGYEVPADGFGFRGVRLTPAPGGSAKIEVTRTGIARRLGRITGAGLFAQSRKLGRRIDADSGVVGCDSVQNAVHRGRLFWVWGDTTLFHYPLGVFHASAATTPVRPFPDLAPPLEPAFDYFRDEAGRPRGVARIPGRGPTWLTGLVSLPDEDGRARLVAAYAKIRPPMDVYEWGLCAWNEDAERFERVRVVWTDEGADGAKAGVPRRPPAGHATRWTDGDGAEWVLFGNPFPASRCRATYEAWLDVARWESRTPQETVPIAGADDPAAAVTPHSGSIAWHPWRKRWVAVFVQARGEPSAFGEVWYAEADEPSGPWGPAVKVLSHADYTFYNPRIHAEWLEADSPVLAFEGTFTQTFAKDPDPVPRHDYNQILYRLDLDDPALASARGE